jgi:hypothetical protein
MLTVIGALAIGVVQWRSTPALNDPYRTVVAHWTVGDIPQPRAFIGLGVFDYRPNWSGDAQVFDGPVLLEVEDAQTPVRIRFSGAVTIGRRGDENLTTGTVTATATATEATLTSDDLVAIPAGIGFAIATGDGQAIRLQAVVVLPGGPPRTPGIPHVEWRAWGTVSPAPNAPLAVTVADIYLAGGEAYQFQRELGPALLSVEGSGDGTQSIALTVTKGRGTYLHVADVAPWELTTPVSYVATPTPTVLNRERAFEARSGTFLPTGTEAKLRNRSLVDGTGVRLVTFDGPAETPPAASPAATRPPG